MTFTRPFPASADQAGSELLFRRLALGESLIDYNQAWALQRDIHTHVSTGTMAPTVLLLEHTEVFTAGKRTQPQDRPNDASTVVEVDRGGRITWHGPGQLVAYPIVRLPQPFDVVAFVRQLEEATIRTCADFGVETSRVEGRSGVWCGSGSRKIAAIGVRVARGVTMHGMALNVDCDLSWSEQIVPCGISDASVTSLAHELGEAPRLREVADTLESHLRETIRIAGGEK